MKWVKNWFAYKEGWWTGRAKESEKEQKRGHTVYVWRQVALWNGFLTKAQEAFKLAIK